MEKGSLQEEIGRRRTFAIIAHPDAGKTTLTEKLLLYGGAIQMAGAVKARKNRKSATSDWMDMEKERGISITSTALQFEYSGFTLNLLDTPGHEDFSEDTYRTLMAADTAIMVLDAAKGVEPQTKKLFKVCREREIPIITFVNKMDRPTKNIFSLLDEIAEVLGISAIPYNWPIGTGYDFSGIFSITEKIIYKYDKTPGGALPAPVQSKGADSPEFALLFQEEIVKVFQEEMDLIVNGMDSYSSKEFLNCTQTPVFFGSAVNNFGIQVFLDQFVKIAPAPDHVPLTDGSFLDPAQEDLSGFVFKVQANMNKVHRDRIAFVRITSGRFERGVNARHNRLEKPVKLNSSFTFFGQERTTVDTAYPGDIIGLVNPGTFQIGDILFSGKDAPKLRPLPVFAPEIFASISTSDTSVLKGFRKGIDQLSEEGILHVFSSKSIGSGNPIIGALGSLQFDVFQRRLKDEFGVETNLNVLPYSILRWVQSGQEAMIPSEAAIVIDKNMRSAILFDTEWDLNYFIKKYPDLVLKEMP